jgi:hypothetical protein
VRFASLLLLALWIGGLAVLGGVTAPALFDTLQAQDPATGRALAGTLFGAVLLRFHHWSWLAGGALLVLIGIRAALGPPPRHFKIQMMVVAAMLALSAYSALVISPSIDEIRRTAAGTIQSLPDGDPAKVRFGRLHGLSNVMMLVTLVAGVWLFRIESSD